MNDGNPFEDIEQKLIETRQQAISPARLDGNALQHRANVQLGVRDAVTFGFAQMMAAMLQMFVQGYKLIRSTDGQHHINNK